MKKKVIILALCTGMLAGTTAGAQKVEIMADSQTVILSDSISPNTLGICFVVKEGESIDDDSKVYALKNAYSDAEGKIEFSFVMPETKNDELLDGKYDVYIKEEGKVVRQDEDGFYYASLDSRTALMDAVRDLSRDAHDALQDILENPDNLIVLKAIGCETEYYNEDIAEIMCDMIADFSAIDTGDFKDAYNTAAAAGGFADADEEEADELLKVVNPVFEGVQYKDIEDENLTEWLSSYFSGNTYSAEKYEIANILYKFNTSVADKIDDLFDDYDEVLEITEDDRYEDYDELRRKATANGKIAEALDKKPAKTVEDLLKVVKKAMDDDNGGGNGVGGAGLSPSVKPIVSGVPTDTQIVVGNDPSFKDLGDAIWAKDAIVGLAKAGIVSGDENGNFRPNDYISREEYVSMLVRAAGKYNKDATCEFNDVPKSAWYYSYVASANEYGVTHGISEKEFGIGMALTRQDMAVLSLRAKGDVTKVRDSIVFADNEKIADYAKDAVEELYMSGAVNGTGNGLFNPLGQATRAECAQIIFNLFLK